MPMKMLVPGRLITWSRPGRFGVEARAYAYRRGDALVWIDPLAPDDADVRAVEAFGLPSHLIVTLGSHCRDAESLRERYGCPVWLPGVEGGDRGMPGPDHVYTWQSELPAGLRAVHIPGVGAGEHAVVGDIDGRRFAFVGESVVHAPHRGWLGWLWLAQPRGGLQHRRFFFHQGGRRPEALKEAKRLLSLELEMLLPTLGAPILHDARGALRESLSAW